MDKNITSLRNFSDVYFDKTSSDDIEKRYFAACNTCRGFKNYFPEIFNFDTLKKIYVLKGGPGCGKSTLLKRIAIQAKLRGYSTELFHCSSSPYSLDGVIINELSVGVLDGTSPHAFEPVISGCTEIIVDLGRSFDTEALFEKKETLAKLTNAKKQEYKSAYKLLSCVNDIDSYISDFVSPHIYYGKMRESIKRIFKKNISKGTAYKEIPRIVHANSCAGNIYMKTFSDMAGFTYFISDCKGAEKVFMDEVKIFAKNYLKKTLVSYNPTNPDFTDAVYFPDDKVLFSTLCRANYDKKINTERFIDSAEIKKSKEKLLFAAKLKKSLYDGAYSSFYNAGILHEKIESIYTPAIDFDCINSISEFLVNKIFK